MISSENPEIQDIIKKLIFQQQACSNYQLCEAGLEKAYRHVFEMIKQGRGEEISQIVIVSDEKTNEGALCPLQLVRYDQQHLQALQEVLGDDFLPPENTGNCDQDLENFYTYFFTRYQIAVNVIVTKQQNFNYGKVYLAVAEATGGVTEDFYSCNYVQFFNQVGQNLAANAPMGICLEQPVDSPFDLTVFFLENEELQEVPPSYTEGWSHDPVTNCIDFNGLWKEKYGSYEIVIKSHEEKVFSQACFPPGVDPLPNTIRVFFNGEKIPADSTEGWVFEPKNDCLRLNGSFNQIQGLLEVQYL